MANARMIEKNAFIVLIYSFLAALARLLERRRVRSPERFRRWARQDSNLGPRDYESPALTAELQARLHIQYGVSFAVPRIFVDGMLTFPADLCIVRTL